MLSSSQARRVYSRFPLWDNNVANVWYNSQRFNWRRYLMHWCMNKMVASFCRWYKRVFFVQVKFSFTLVQHWSLSRGDQWTKTVPSYYQNQCWLIIRRVIWYSPKTKFAGTAKTLFGKITSTSLRARRFSLFPEGSVYCLIGYLESYYGWVYESS